MSHFVLRSSGNYEVPNPNPYRFKILEAISLDGIHTMLRINYPGCTSYNGDKIAIYKRNPKDLIHLKFLDPHFLEGIHMNSPIARFPASEEGILNAMLFLKSINKETK